MVIQKTDFQKTPLIQPHDLFKKVEVLIALGARHIIGVGSCGSLDEKLRIGHLVIPENAIPDEGTSSHYPLQGKKIKASPRIFKMIQSLCEVKVQDCVLGKVWTTDAPFRETPQKIKKAQQKKKQLRLKWSCRLFLR